MDICIRKHFLCYCEHSRIRYNKCIRTHFLKLLKVSSCTLKVIVMCQDISCNINLNISFMGELNTLFLNPNASPPIYTASAPNITAIFKTSRLLAGMRSSVSLPLYICPAILSSFPRCFSTAFLYYCFTLNVIPSPIGTIDVTKSSECVSSYTYSRILA